MSIIGAGNSLRPTLNIYSCSGVLLASISWKAGRLVEMGWSEDERLVCVSEDGTVTIYAATGRMIQNFSMGPECRDERVHFCCIWGGGVACLTRNNTLVYVDDLEEPQPRRMPYVSDSYGEAHCMCVIESHMTASKGLEVLLAVDKTVLTIDLAGVTDHKLAAGPVKAMTVCPNGKMLACFTADGVVWVLTTDFAKNLSEFPTKSHVAPSQLAWCGTDSVVLYWSKLLLMVGPYGDWVKYSYEEALCLIPEYDSVRVVSDTRHELLQRVPNACVEVLKLGSCTPAAMLLDAKQLLDSNDSKADDVLRSILDSLPQAVWGCVQAAVEETDVSLQKALLAAAAYGQALMGDACEGGQDGRARDGGGGGGEELTNLLARLSGGAEASEGRACIPPAVAPILRVLNQLRNSEVGIPITLSQLGRLTLPALLVRLARRGLLYLALQVACYLGLATDQVVEEWAVERMVAGTDMGDDLLYEVLLPRLKEHEVSLASVAASAWRLGRTTLAKLLLNQETRSGEQVPLMISLGEDRQALVKACESNDGDLVYLALLHLLRRHSAQDLLVTCSRLPLAKSLLLSYMRQKEPRALFDAYLSLDQPLQAAHVRLRDAMGVVDVQARKRALEGVSKAHSGSKIEAVKHLAAATREQILLIDAQLELEALTGSHGEYVGGTAAETVRLCFRYNHHKRGMKLAKDVGMHEKLLSVVKVEGLAEGNDWVELDKMSKERKMPLIGWETFVDACWANGRVDEALKYVAKMTDHTQRVDMCIKMERYKEAATAAASARDVALLHEIRSRAKTPTDIALIDNLIADCS